MDDHASNSATERLPAAAESRKRTRLSCATLGVGLFLVCFFAAGIPAAVLANALGGFRESMSYIAYEAPSLLLLSTLASSLLGALMGAKSFGPAARAMTGERVNPPFWTKSVMHAGRGPMAMLATYFVPRWELLIGVTETPWRILPRIAGGAALATAFLLPYFMGRDSDFRLSMWACGGLGILVADCLLVNRIAMWRRSGDLVAPATRA